MSDGHDLGLEILGLSKAYDGVQAVDDVTIRARPGVIVGLLGPNGAGKTSTIRIIMGILGADLGDVLYGGESLTPEARRQFGYLPEERGLYQKQKLAETLVYLTELKGLSHKDATLAVGEQIEALGLGDHANLPISTLSKGNQQKAQFIAAIVHRPDVIILDEPFSGLDPVNQLLLKEIIQQRKDEGAVILLSSHQMDQVERLCDEISLINDGQVVLEGSLADIKERFSDKRMEVTFDGEIPNEVDRWLSDVTRDGSTISGNLIRSMAESLVGLVALGQVAEFKMRQPTLEDIFIDIVQESGQ